MELKLNFHEKFSKNILTFFPFEVRITSAIRIVAVSHIYYFMPTLILPSSQLKSLSVWVCVCVCVRERERESDGGKDDLSILRTTFAMLASTTLPDSHFHKTQTIFLFLTKCNKLLLLLLKLLIMLWLIMTSLTRITNNTI